MASAGLSSPRTPAKRIDRTRAERVAMVERYAVAGATAGDMTAGCLMLDIKDDAGQVVGLVALDIVGDTATITAAQRDDNMRPQDLARVEEVARAHGAKTLKFWTKRPALVRSMQRAGFALVSAEMTKAI